jgi:hypothetical protein
VIEPQPPWTAWDLSPLSGRPLAVVKRPDEPLFSPRRLGKPRAESGEVSPLSKSFA